MYICGKGKQIHEKNLIWQEVKIKINTPRNSQSLVVDQCLIGYDVLMHDKVIFESLLIGWGPSGAERVRSRFHSPNPFCHFKYRLPLSLKYGSQQYANHHSEWLYKNIPCEWEGFSSLWYQLWTNLLAFSSCGYMCCTCATCIRQAYDVHVYV